MEFRTKCLELCKKLGIGKWTLSEDLSENYFEFDLKEIYILKKETSIMDGTYGGLVLGNLHYEGGIHLIKFISETKLRYVGEMEGWEYLSSPYNHKDIKNFEKFDKINKRTPHKNRFLRTDFKIPKNCKIIDLRLIEVPFLIVEHNQAIINRFATKRHIKKLIKVDQKNCS